MVDSKENNKFDMRVKGLSSFANIRASISPVALLGSGEKSSVESNLSIFIIIKDIDLLKKKTKL